MWPILIVSLYHLWTGICMLLLPVLPHPFGQIEPFRNLGLSDQCIGVVLVSGATLALTGLFLGIVWHVRSPRIRFTRRSLLILPQQIIITYAAYAAVLEVQNSIEAVGIASDMTARFIFALNISTTFAVVHAIGSINWLSDPIRWKSRLCNDSADRGGCPYKMAEQLRSKHLPEHKENADDGQ